jgi:putative membrane protein
MFTRSTALTRRYILAAAALAGVAGLVVLTADFGRALPRADAKDPAGPIAKEVLKFELSRASAGAVHAQVKLGADADADFLTKVIPATAASVEIIEYAAKHASDDKVRDFAERVAKQHQEFVKTATAHANRLNIAVVTDPEKDSQATIDKLSKVKGIDLDVAFLIWLSDGHENTAVFEDEVKNGDDTDLKTFANNAIASGHEHLHEARAILAKLKN